jgi:hypothetical protein
MASLFEIAEKIIEEKGGDAYKETWLRQYLSDPDRESEFMAELLKKQTAEALKKAKDKTAPPKIQ